MRRFFAAFFVIFSFAYSFAELKNVRVGYYRDSPPFMNGKSESDPKGGYAYEYLQYIASHTGWKYEYVYGEFDELYQKLLSGEIDILGDISYYKDREGLFHYPDYPMGTESYYLYTSTPKADVYASDLSTLNGKTIWIGTDSYQKYELERWLGIQKSKGREIDLKITEMNYEDVHWEDFDAGKFDIMLSMDSVAEPQWEPIVKLNSSDIYLVVTKNRTDLLDELNEALAEIYISEPYYNAKLWDKYYTSAAQTKRLSATEKKWFEENGTIRIAVFRDDLPFAGYDEKSEDVSGLVCFFMDEMSETFMVNPNIEYKVFDKYTDAEKALSEHEVTAIFPYAFDLEFAEKHGFMLSKTFAVNEFVFVYKNSESISMDTIAVEEGKRAQPYAMTSFKNSRKVVCEDIDDCLKKIAKGEVTGAVFSNYRLNRALFGSRKYSNMKAFTLPNQFQLSMCANAEDYPFISVFNKLLNTIPAEDIGARASAFSMDSKKYTIKDFINDYFALIATCLFVFMAVLLALFATLDRLKLAINYDVLTHLQNRRKLTPYMKQALTKANTKGEPFSILIFDLDDFKKVNDTYGHAAGDEILKMAANTISKGIKQNDLAFRWGGEEFLVLMKAEREIVLKAAERIRADIEKQRVEYGTNRIKITATIGISSFKEGSTPESMFLEADSNLYKGKNNGKNQVSY